MGGTEKVVNCQEDLIFVFNPLLENIHGIKMSYLKLDTQRHCPVSHAHIFPSHCINKC